MHLLFLHLDGFGSDCASCLVTAEGLRGRGHCPRSTSQRHPCCLSPAARHLSARNAVYCSSSTNRLARLMRLVLCFP